MTSPGLSPGPSTVTSEEALFPLASLPEDCLHVAFSHCSPRDIGRFACVNATWKAAASVAWSKTAPWAKHAASKFPALRNAESPAAAYSAVLKGVHTEDGAWMLSADVSTGLLSLHVSVVDAFGITWLNKSEPTGYWEVREQVPGSSFPTCAYLRSVCLFQIEGDIDLPVSQPGFEPQPPAFGLPPGWYEVLWKAAKTPAFEWTDDAARATVDAEGTVLIQDVSVDFRRPGQPFCTRFPALALQEQEGEGPGSSNPAHTGGGAAEEGRQQSGSAISFPLPLSHAGSAAERREIPNDFADGDENEDWAEEEHEDERECDDAAVGSEGWELYSVGEIFIEAGNRGIFRAKVSLQVPDEPSWWKSGLLVDSLILSQLA